MKILLLTDGIYPFSMGGMQKHSYNLARYLVTEGAELTVAHCVYGNTSLPDDRTVLKETGLNPKCVVGFRFPKSLPFPGHYVFHSKKYSKQLYEYFSPELKEYDVVYAQGFTAWHLLGKTNPKDRPPVIVNLHGVEMYQPAFSAKERAEKTLLKIPAKYLIRNADYLQSLGGKLTPLLQGLSGRENVWECGIGIEKSWFRNSEEITLHSGKIRFAFVGRHEKRKGLHLLNPVLEQLKNSGIGFGVDFIGDVPFALRLRGEEFTYHGKLTEEEKIREVLDRCDVLLLPSLSEGMPTVILEAMARGMAILATDVGAVERLVDEENGWLVEAGNQTALLQKIRKVCELSKEDMLTKKLYSLVKVKEFEWTEIAKQYLVFFEKII